MGAGLWQRLRQKLPNVSLLQRIVIANTVIIIAGAIGGTVLTVHLVNVLGQVSLILLFVAVGVLISFVSNYLLVRAALDPLYQLRDRAGAVAAGERNVEPDVAADADRDVRQLADALGALVEQLESRNSELQALSQRVISAQEAERKRIARSLHDDTSQYLSMLIVQLERLEQRLPPEGHEWRAQLVSCRQSAQQILQELRKIMYGLRPTVLDDLGLAPAIHWYGRLMLEEAGIRATFNLPNESPGLTDQQGEALFRIAQEAITNIVNHAGACQATIELKTENDLVCLLVADNGCGFDPATIGKQRLGLLSMQERAALIQGNFELDTAPGRGTRVQIRLVTSATQEGQDG